MIPSHNGFNFIAKRDRDYKSECHSSRTCKTSKMSGLVFEIRLSFRKVS